MHATILQELSQIETTSDVRILFAVESGSRAWGFASRNSDYDVRFIYLNRPQWYLSLRDRRDVIERPISDDLDICGWDLRKALGLFAKSNPPLLEWLGSPITYQDRHGLAQSLRHLLATSFSPQRCLYHYLHMAQGNYREYLKGDVVRLKKYLYVLRPLLACLWIEKHGTMPPTEFGKLVEDARLSPSLKVTIDDLLRRKMAGDELDAAPSVPILNEFIEKLLDHYACLSKKGPGPTVDFDALDQVFLDMLHDVWREASSQIGGEPGAQAGWPEAN